MNSTDAFNNEYSQGEQGYARYKVYCIGSTYYINRGVR